LIGPLLIALAAFLWATDALFRVPAVAGISATTIVWFEHALSVVLLLPFLLIRYGKKSWQLTRREWISAALVGVLGSALATVLFTLAFQYLNPSAVILIQKIQPVLVIYLAVLFLQEKPAPEFLFWGGVAILSAAALALTDASSEPLPEGQKFTAQALGALLSLGAALLWAVSTVAGKSLLRTQPAIIATFWRFVFGLIALTLIAPINGSPWIPQTNTSGWMGLVYMSLVPGLFAMLAYYSGMERTRASTVTIVELLYPVCAIGLNALFLQAYLAPTQWVAALLLVLSVTLGTRGNLESNSRVS
jgi:drug/metabolite transporter (DMT)-like permease